MTDLQARAAAAQAVVGARDLAGAGRSLAARRDDLGAEISTVAAGRPWGDDRAGEVFDRRYRAIERQVLDACEQLAAYVESLGEAAERSAAAAMTVVPPSTLVPAPVPGPAAPAPDTAPERP
jgi:hypothetical protein